MLEAVVGVALRAILASVVLGGVLAGLVLIATRALALTATTRHALWTSALIATAVMPLAGVAVSMTRAYAAPAPAVIWHAVPSTTSATSAVSAEPIAVHAKRPAHAAAASSTHSDTARPASLSAAPVSAASLADRLPFAAWTPRLTRTLALALVAVWALGALIGTIGLAASIARVRGLKRRSSPLDGTLADELPWLTAADARREIYLRLSYETETPVAIGFRRPVILIPTELATADGLAAIEPLVLHEHAHLRRYDDWTNLVQRTIERVFWFNPIVWLVGRRIALEREIASDDAVVEKTGEAHAYATSLWKLVREMRMPEHAVVAPGALLTRKQIAVRIEQLLDKKRARLHRSPAAAAGVALAGVLAVAFVATSAPAVELPAANASVAAVTAAPGPHPWHERSSGAPPKTVVKYVVAEKLTTAKATSATTTVANTTPAQTAATKNAAKATAPKTPARTTNVTPVVHERVVYVHDAPPVPASNAMPPPRLATVVPPVMPAAPPVAMPSMPARAVAALQAASAAASAQAAASVREATRNIGPEVARTLHEAMAAIPREIAQEAAVRPSRHARYDGAKLSRELVASCTGCSFRNSDMRGLDLHDLRITGTDFSGSDMRGANLANTRLNGVSLARTNLATADLRGAALNGVDLDQANFDGTLLDNVKLSGVSLRRLSLRGTALRSIIAGCTGCDLTRMDLHGQDLHGIALFGADLNHADLHDANLSGVHFAGVDFSGANLAGADLTNARLDGCDLSSVNIRGARTTGMTLTGSGFDS